MNLVEHFLIKLFLKMLDLNLAYIFKARMLYAFGDNQEVVVVYFFDLLILNQ